MLCFCLWCKWSSSCSEIYIHMKIWGKFVWKFWLVSQWRSNKKKNLIEVFVYLLQKNAKSAYLKFQFENRTYSKRSLTKENLCVVCEGFLQSTNRFVEVKNNSNPSANRIVKKIKPGDDKKMELKMLIPLFFVIINTIHCFNLDVNNYIKHKGQDASMFGFSVALHQEMQRSW